MLVLPVAAVRNQDTAALIPTVSMDNIFPAISSLHTVDRVVSSLAIAPTIASLWVLSVPRLRAVLGVAIGLLLRLLVLLKLTLVIAPILLVLLARLE